MSCGRSPDLLHACLWVNIMFFPQSHSHCLFLGYLLFV